MRALEFLTVHVIFKLHYNLSIKNHQCGKSAPKRIIIMIYPLFFFHRRITPSRPTLADNNVRIEIVSSIKKKKIVPSQPEDDCGNDQVKKTPKTNLSSETSKNAKGPIDIISVSGHSLSAMSPASATSNLSLELEKDATEP